MNRNQGQPDEAWQHGRTLRSKEYHGCLKMKGKVRLMLDLAQGVPTHTWHPLHTLCEKVDIYLSENSSVQTSIFKFP